MCVCVLYFLIRIMINLNHFNYLFGYHIFPLHGKYPSWRKIIIINNFTSFKEIYMETPKWRYHGNRPKITQQHRNTQLNDVESNNYSKSIKEQINQQNLSQFQINHEMLSEHVALKIYNWTKKKDVNQMCTQFYCLSNCSKYFDSLELETLKFHYKIRN